MQVVQELYEKKLVTYPRTDARVLSSAVAKEIHKNIGGLKNIPSVKAYAEAILEKGTYKNIAKTRYVNDKQITDHYAIIPTGQGFGAIRTLNQTSLNVYETIVRRFLGIFCPPAIYQKISLVTGVGTEKFFSNFKVLAEPGYLKVMEYSFQKKKESDNSKNNGEESEESCDVSFMEILSGLKKGMELNVKELNIKEGETAPPKRYNSGSMILVWKMQDSSLKMRSCVHRLKEVVSALVLPVQRF